MLEIMLRHRRLSFGKSMGNTRTIRHLEMLDSSYEGMERTVLFNKDNPAEGILPGKGNSCIKLGFGTAGIQIGVFLLAKQT